MNSNSSSRKIQQERDKSTKKNADFKQGAIDKVMNFTSTAALVFNHIASIFNEHNEVFISQSTLALYASCTREYANELIKQMTESGCLIKVYRHKKTCLYKIPSVFYLPEVRAAISSRFSSFRRIFRDELNQAVMLLTLTTAISTGVPTKNLTQYKGVININTKYKKERGVWPPKAPAKSEEKNTKPPPDDAHERRMVELDAKLRIAKTNNELFKLQQQREANARSWKNDPLSKMSAEQLQYLNDNPHMRAFLEKILTSQIGED